jgi:tetratricopeptide (TPR) repeat protein
MRRRSVVTSGLGCRLSERRLKLAGAVLVGLWIAPAAHASDACLSGASDDIIIDACSYSLRETPIALYFMSRARVYGRKGRYDLALKDVDATLRLEPRNAEAWTVRCFLRGMTGLQEQAVADCDQALRFDPKADQALFWRGVAYLRLAQYDKAGADLETLLQRDPKNAGLTYGRGLAQLWKGDEGPGRADIAAATALEADIAEAFERLTGLSADKPPVPIAAPSPAPHRARLLRLPPLPARLLHRPRSRSPRPRRLRESRHRSNRASGRALSSSPARTSNMGSSPAVPSSPRPAGASTARRDRRSSPCAASSMSTAS